MSLQSFFYQLTDTTDPDAFFAVGPCGAVFGPDSPIIKGGAPVLEAGGLLCERCDKLVSLSDLVAIHLFDEAVPAGSSLPVSRDSMPA